jgi:serine/threonine protein phosphatase PrpC
MRISNYITDSIKSPFRERNEDKAFVIETSSYKLFFLFDGVGSALHALEAVEISFRFISDNYKNYEQDEKFQLSKLMHDTHVEILNSKLTDALSTYVAVFVPNKEGQEISISSMGDSRLYGISNQYIFQYTEDDDIPNIKNAITKSLGMLKLIDSDFIQKDILAYESRFLLSSDGFYKLMEKNMQNFYEIFNFKRLVNSKKALEKIVTGHNSDDATYILIETHV